MSDEGIPDTLVSEFAAIGLDLRSRDFPQRYVEQWVGSRRLISKYERLLEHMRWRETAETGGVAAPERTQKPQLGTTVGDLGDLPTGDSPLENSDALVEELRARLDRLFNQGGIRVGRGEAGGTDSRDPLSGSSPEPGESGAGNSAIDALVGLIVTIWNVLNAQAAKDKAEAQAAIRELKAQAEEDRARIKRLEDELLKIRKGNPAKRPIVDEVNPAGTLTVGGMAPKKPGEPGDPVPDDPRTEASSVLKQRGQETDPNPAAEEFGPGALKTIRTPSDAVTDPPRSPERVGMFRK